MDEREAVAEREQEVRTYSELWHISGLVLDFASKQATWPYLVSPLMAAFAFEAYLNHVGAAINAPGKRKKTFGWLSPKSKLDTICRCLDVRLGPELDRPYSTLTELFTLRATIVHGRTEILKPAAETMPLSLAKERVRAPLLTEWQAKMSEPAFAERVREDVFAIVHTIHANRPEPKEHPFTFGMGLYGVSLK